MREMFGDASGWMEETCGKNGKTSDNKKQHMRESNPWGVCEKNDIKCTQSGDQLYVLWYVICCFLSSRDGVDINCVTAKKWWWSEMFIPSTPLYRPDSPRESRRLHPFGLSWFWWFSCGCLKTFGMRSYFSTHPNNRVTHMSNELEKRKSIILTVSSKPFDWRGLDISSKEYCSDNFNFVICKCMLRKYTSII